MVSRIIHITVFFMLLGHVPVLGQNLLPDNRRVRTISTESDSILLDSLPVSIRSVHFFDTEGQEIADSLSFRISYNRLIWNKPPAGMDSLEIRFRVLYFPYRGAYMLRDSSRILPLENQDYIGFDYTPFRNSSQSLFEEQDLVYNGSFVRGLSFGNNQNLAVNSNFNLQMNGRLGEDIEVLASISDNNIPVEPEGNTQQLQEFDKIFIQLKRGESSLLAGDYELKKPTGYFINYFKKLQGASISHRQETGKSGALRTTASLAVARGKFARNLIQGEEGNQGPYRLKGAENEQFITILSGTEKIYMDGELLTRGIEYDYVIDYNRGDITFTNKRLITKDIRIIAEFEYADRQFLRSLYTLESEWTHPKGAVFFNLISQQDDKSSAGAGDLTPAQRLALQEAGDSPEGILVSGVAPYEDNLNPVQYVRMPNPYTNGSDSILVPVQIAVGSGLCSLPDPLNDLLTEYLSHNPPVFAARFSQVAAGQGTYIRCQEAFGTLFIYSKPDSMGNLTGDYVPLIRLTPPESQQMYSLGGQYKIGKQGSLKAEVSMSNLDLNRYSEEGDEDDRGFAVRSEFSQPWMPDKEDKTWSGELTAYLEHTGSRFTYLNPFRNAEFARDWLLDGESDTTVSELLSGTGFQVARAGILKAGYQFSIYRRGEAFSGNRHTYDLELKSGILTLRAFGTETQASSTFQTSSFSRPRLKLTATFPVSVPIEAGIYGEREKSLREKVGADTLLGNSFHYDLVRAFIKIAEGGAFQLESSLSRRWDYLPLGDNLAKSTEADIFNIQGTWRQQENSTLSWNFNIRDIRIAAPELTDEKAQRTYLGRLDYGLNLWKGAVRSNTSYELGSGQEQKVEFIYKRVDPGILGTHYWNDLNDDGVIQVEEVELPPYPEAADLVRIPQLTGTFLRTDNVMFNQSIWVEPRLFNRGNTFWDRLMQKISWQSAIRILRKTRGPSDAIRTWDPFQRIEEDSLLISLTSGVQHNLFINRVSPLWDLQLSSQTSDNFLTLGTGPDGRLLKENRISGRWNLNRAWSLRLTAGRGSKSRKLGFQQALQAGNYQIRSSLLAPELTWLFSQNLRSSLRYEYEAGRNEPQFGGEEALQSRFVLESVVNTGEKAALRLNISLVQIKFEGIANTPAAFALMNGLQNGRNYLWNFSLDRQLAQNILLNLTYEGRQSSNNPIVHLGKAQLRANF